MTTSEERLKILRMVEEGKISAEEGARLLAALGAGPRRESEPAAAARGAQEARSFRVRVTDLSTGRPKVNVNIPMGLVNVALKMGARFAPDIEGVNMAEIVEAIRSGQYGKIVDVSDAESGERVEVYVE